MPRHLPPKDGFNRKELREKQVPESAGKQVRAGKGPVPGRCLIRLRMEVQEVTGKKHQVCRAEGVLREAGVPGGGLLRSWGSWDSCSARKLTASG